MRRAGWEVWIAYDLDGSYEEMPPNLIDELKRDRRWCQGNLMNFRLFLMQRPASGASRGVHDGRHGLPVRAAVVPFLVLSTALLARAHADRAAVFRRTVPAFPVWPEWHPAWAMGLLSATAILLFPPKSSAAADAGARRRHFGGAAPSWLSVLRRDRVLDAARADPHAVPYAVRRRGARRAGRQLEVAAARGCRDDAGARRCAATARTRCSASLGRGVYWLDPRSCGGCCQSSARSSLSIPLSVYSSRVSLGRRLRRAGLLCIPEESDPPEEFGAPRSTPTGPNPRRASSTPLSIPA